MKDLSVPTLNLTFNASGAVEGARRGDVVIIVDVIDMSTSAEAALEAGALTVFGASPTGCKAPVNLNPDRIGYLAGKKALKHKTSLIIVAEPRHGDEEEPKKRSEFALTGVVRSGAEAGLIIPNIGCEITKLVDFNEKVVLFVTGAGGVAFDAAYNNGASAVLTATIARTPFKKGNEPARIGILRAIETANKLNCGITIVAASSNSLEDVLAGEYLAKMAIGEGFINIKLV